MPVCAVCQDKTREAKILVVEDTKDAITIEKMQNTMDGIIF